MASLVSGCRALIWEAVNSKVYFFRWGMTNEISFTRSSTGPLSATAAIAAPFRLVPIIPFEIVLIGSPASSILRFLEAGSEGLEVRISEM
jgi:hypothetical protein